MLERLCISGCQCVPNLLSQFALPLQCTSKALKLCMWLTGKGRGSFCGSCGGSGVGLVGTRSQASERGQLSLRHLSNLSPQQKAIVQCIQLLALWQLIGSSNLHTRDCFGEKVTRSCNEGVACAAKNVALQGYNTGTIALEMKDCKLVGA